MHVNATCLGKPFARSRVNCREKRDKRQCSTHSIARALNNCGRRDIHRVSQFRSNTALSRVGSQPTYMGCEIPLWSSLSLNFITLRKKATAKALFSATSATICCGCEHFWGQEYDFRQILIWPFWLPPCQQLTVVSFLIVKTVTFVITAKLLSFYVPIILEWMSDQKELQIANNTHMHLKPSAAVLQLPRSASEEHSFVLSPLITRWPE